MKRTLRRLLPFCTACALGAALLAGNASAEPAGMVEHFPTDCYVGPLVSGPDGNVWFTCFKFNSRQGLIGRVTPAGEVTEFSDGIEQDHALGDIVVGPDGNLWFTIYSGFDSVREEKTAIGRITPSGQITVFKLGRGYIDSELVPSRDGNLWFFNNTPGGLTIDRITTRGAVTAFPTGVRKGVRPTGLTLAPDGNLWAPEVFRPVSPIEGDPPTTLIARIGPDGTLTEFGSVPERVSLLAGTIVALGPAVVGADRNLWFRGATPEPAIDRITPDGQITEFKSGLASSPEGQLAPGPDGNLWFSGEPTRNGGAAIGRITPSGQIAEFSQCLNYQLPYSAPRSIVAGPDGNLWFTSVTSFIHEISEAPTIGRITSSGQITQFRAGVGSEPSSIIAGPDGRVWFSGGAERIERITPTNAPINTFVLERPKRANARGLARMGVQVPGPGTLQLRQVALRAPHKRPMRLRGKVTTATAGTCGETSLKLQMRGKAKSTLLKRGRVREKVEVTFTPTGGTPYTQVSTVSLRGPTRHH
jgi:streptogramin lyase